MKQTITGLNKLKVNLDVLLNELKNTPEVLAEAIQTILRKNGYENAYEILKKLTRGKNISMIEIRKFIEKLDINNEDKERLLELEPQNYVGLASKLVNML
jgi:adenylosuccinate lyase